MQYIEIKSISFKCSVCNLLITLSTISGFSTDTLYYIVAFELASDYSSEIYLKATTNAKSHLCKTRQFACMLKLVDNFSFC